MDIDLGEAYEVVAREMRSNPEDFSAAVAAGGDLVVPDDPDWGYTDIWEDVYERLEDAALVRWVPERSGMYGSVSISLLPLTPDSVWLLRHVFFDENEFEFIREFPTLAAAREGVSDAFVDLLDFCGLPDRVALPDGFSVSRFREFAKARLTRGKWDLSPSPWTWAGMAESLERVANGPLPHQTEGERDTLLDRYVDVACG